MNRSMLTFLLILIVSPFLFAGVVCGGCAACVTADGVFNGGPRPPEAKPHHEREKKHQTIETF